MILIEQPAEDVKLSFEFQTNAEISGIRLANANIARTPDFVFDESGGVLTSGVSFKPVDRRRQNHSITLAVEFDFRIWAGEEEPRDLARIRCRFDADYDLHPDFDPSEPQIAAFHNGNAVFNCWPYFREFIQSTTVRMSLPPATVPFLRLVPIKKPQVIDAKGTQVTAPAEAPAKRISAPAPKPAKKKKRVE
jgi:hypothetical protein